MATFARGHWTGQTAIRNAKLRRDIDRNSQTNAGTITWIITAGDELTLRGIPAIGRGVAGAIRGTRPDSVTNQ